MVSFKVGMCALAGIFTSVLLIQLAASAPASSSSRPGQVLVLDPAGQNPAIALANLPPLANLSNSDKGNCASAYRYSNWKAKEWTIEDCYSAVQQLFIMEVLTHPDEPFEFVDKGASATKPKLTSQRTPKKYVVGEQCFWFPKQ